MLVTDILLMLVLILFKRVLDVYLCVFYAEKLLLMFIIKRNNVGIFTNGKILD